jgi:hypothetical protein
MHFEQISLLTLDTAHAPDGYLTIRIGTFQS